MTADILIYGANGFTGELLARRARERGLQAILAGRNRGPIERLARELGLPHRVFDLGDLTRAREGVGGARLVLHCAGPFARTSRPMLDACLAEHAHYLDITGEYTVIDAVLGRDAEARAAGVVAMPAVGFDVVPTDCMAASLKAALPSATHLELAFGG